MQPKYVFLYTTFDSQEAGAKFVKHLLENNLIACANLGGAMTSYYMWEGALQESQEFPLWMKTIKNAVPEITQILKDHHPYDCPCLVEIPITDGYPPFLKFIEDAVKI